MRERPADTARAIVLALLVHVALALVLFVGLWWTRAAAPAAAAGAMSAEVVDASALSDAMQRTIADRAEPAVPPEPTSHTYIVPSRAIVMLSGPSSRFSCVDSTTSVTVSVRGS